MKTKMNPILAVAAVLMALIIHAGAKGAAALPVGNWTVTFANGIVQTCEIAADGTAKVSDPQRKATGKATSKDGVVEILFEDDRLERWAKREGEMAVEHWHPASNAKDPRWAPIMGVAQKNVEADLEVHEWGTFTLLMGSDGQVIEWYQAPNKLVDLPAFVQRTAFLGGGKSGSLRYAGKMDTVRMETPVLYFYPKEEMDITVSASFPNGRITEVFPPLAGPGLNQSVWRGTLLPPDSPERSKVPVASGAPGRHYGAARAVPEAWLFCNKALPRGLKPDPEPVTVTAAEALAAGFVSVLALAKEAPAAPKPPKIHPIDHFIFYRGAGTLPSFRISARQLSGPGTFQLSNNGGATIPKLFALQVADGKSSWVSVEQLKKWSWDSDAKVYLNRETITIPAPAGDAKEVAVELRREMIATLHSEGLTEAEAAAMVATWDDLWFTEPGTRFLAVLPQSYADDMVPLRITPTPKKIERVFVARMEMITRETETVLTSVLNPAVADDGTLGDDAKKLASLQPGRYAAGGMERARTLISQRVQQRFAKLQQERAKQAELQAAAP